MTLNSSNATASSSNAAAGHTPNQSIDGNVATGWMTSPGQPTGWWRYDFGAENEKVVTEYKITGLPASIPAAINMNSWQLRGSNDGINYTVLHSKTENIQAGTVYTYSITNSNQYRYYQINITANQGHSLVGFAEVSFAASVGTGLSVNRAGVVRISESYNLPVKDGASGQVLQTNGSGALTWVTVLTPSDLITVPDTAQPVPVKYHGGYIYVHPIDNSTATDWATAKTTCQNLSAFGKSDWYLPSRLELDAMYKQSYLITGLSQTEIVKYWSSTAKDTNFAYTQRLDYGGPDPDAKTDTTGHNCRCVRKD